MPSIDLRLVDRGPFKEAYLSGLPPKGEPAAEAAGALYKDLVETLAAQGIQPVQEKIYGLNHVSHEVLAAREAALRAGGLDPSLPCTYLEGKPVGDGDLAGVQIWGIVPGKDGWGAVSTVGEPGAWPARCWEAPGFRMVYLPAISGAAPDGDLAQGVTAQAERMFVNAQQALEAHGLGFAQVVRTWIYLARILDWYDEFNRVRRAFFREHGLETYPASTGIQGASGENECTMDVLALEIRDAGGGELACINRTVRQDPAGNYGSSFSRGASLVMGEEQEIVLVSGTASIDARGESRHLGDAEAQIVDTLLNIAAVLDQRGARLQDICQATLFCKDEGIFGLYRRVTRLLELRKLPVVPMIADVCRPELLVEIEAVAVRGAAVDVV